MNKVYSRINFQNTPSTATPLNDTNMNKMDKAINEIDDRVIELSKQTDTAMAIAKGSNNNRSFDTTNMMYDWLSKEANKGVAMIGDKLYIKEAGAKNWWVTEVLNAPNEEGRYYEIAELDTEIVDLTIVNNAIEKLEGEVQDTREHLGISRNLLYVSAKSSGTISELSYEYNEDKSITFNGTPTADVNLQVYGGLAMLNMKLTEDVIFSGCPEGGSEDTYYAKMFISRNGAGVYVNDIGEGYTCEVADDETVVFTTYYICVKAGVTLENVTFRPMIRLASEKNSDYEPYREDRVAELEDEVNRAINDIEAINSNLTTIETYAAEGVLFKKIGKLVDVNYYDFSPYNYDGQITIPEKYLPDRPIITMGLAYTNESNCRHCTIEIDLNGTIASFILDDATKTRIKNTTYRVYGQTAYYTK